MSYSDYDSDGYSSNEDADYVPSGKSMHLDNTVSSQRGVPLQMGGNLMQYMKELTWSQELICLLIHMPSSDQVF